jgi:ribokinase
MSTRLPAVTVVGSINLDIIATTDRLPTAGETIGGGILQQQPGGKGANQAVAAARLGGSARMIGAVGNDAQGRLMLEALSPPAWTLQTWRCSTATRPVPR